MRCHQRKLPQLPDWKNLLLSFFWIIGNIHNTLVSMFTITKLLSIYECMYNANMVKTKMVNDSNRWYNLLSSNNIIKQMKTKSLAHVLSYMKWMASNSNDWVAIWFVTYMSWSPKCSCMWLLLSPVSNTLHHSGRQFTISSEIVFSL